MMNDTPDFADYKKAAHFLFGLLDDIDTASDAAKANDQAYRKIVERIQRRRFEVATTDGYEVFFLGIDEIPETTFSKQADEPAEAL